MKGIWADEHWTDIRCVHVAPAPKLQQSPILARRNQENDVCIVSR